MSDTHSQINVRVERELRERLEELASAALWWAGGAARGVQQRPHVLQRGLRIYAAVRVVIDN
jgi:hypothetical protein